MRRRIEMSRDIKVHGVKQAVGELMRTPRGFHQEVWSSRDEKGEIWVWTSQYLDQNSWTINHPPEEKRVDTAANMYRSCNERMSMTAALKQAAIDVWTRPEMLDILRGGKTWQAASHGARYRMSSTASTTARRDSTGVRTRTSRTM